MSVHRVIWQMIKDKVRCSLWKPRAFSDGWYVPRAHSRSQLPHFLRPWGLRLLFDWALSTLFTYMFHMVVYLAAHPALPGSGDQVL